MQAENWQRVRTLFDELVDQPESTWAAALDQHDIDDPQLREDLLALLRADHDDSMRTGIEAQAPDVLSALSERENTIDGQRLTGCLVGAFRLVEEIGRGGMARSGAPNASMACSRAARATLMTSRPPPSNWMRRRACYRSLHATRNSPLISR